MHGPPPGLGGLAAGHTESVGVDASGDGCVGFDLPTPDPRLGPLRSPQQLPERDESPERISRSHAAIVLVESIPSRPPHGSGRRLHEIWMISRHDREDRVQQISNKTTPHPSYLEGEVALDDWNPRIDCHEALRDRPIRD
jgi:hypothetical protein